MELWSASALRLSAGLHCTPGPKARPELWRTPWSPPHRASKTSTQNPESEQTSLKVILYNIYTHSLFAQGLCVYSRHVQYSYKYIHHLIEGVSTHTPPHTHLRKYRVGGQARFAVTVRWCGGFWPCVWHKGLLHACRPTPTGRIYPAGSLPPGSRSESLTLTKAFPRC